MNKQNKLLLRVVKTALKMAEAKEKEEPFRQHFTFHRPRFHTGLPSTDTVAETPSGKNCFYLEDVEYVKQDCGKNVVDVQLKNGSSFTLSVKEWGTVSSMYGQKPYTSDRKPKEGQVTWCGRLIATKEEYEQENPPSGKIPKGTYTIEELERRGEFVFHQGNGDPKTEGCEKVGTFTSRLITSQSDEIKRLKEENKHMSELLVSRIAELERDNSRLEKESMERMRDIFKLRTELRDLKRCAPTVIHEFKGLPRNCYGEQVIPERWLKTLWNVEDLPKLTLKGFAGEDTPYVEKLLSSLGETPRTLVHCKSPELGTETLVALSPEGEVLLRIVKDNSRKFAVR